MEYIKQLPSPLGRITLASDGTALTGLWFEGQKYYGDTLGCEYEHKELPVFDETARWLDIYFSGRAPGFTPMLRLNTTPFRKEVCGILLDIPFGQTMTYGGIAAQLSERHGKMSAQAVGGAVGHNPISIIIPCHRVVGADGSLTGYAGGIERKEWLLTHEGAVISCK